MVISMMENSNDNASGNEASDSASESSCVEGVTRSVFLRELLRKAAIAGGVGTAIAIANTYVWPQKAAAASGPTTAHTTAT